MPAVLDVPVLAKLLAATVGCKAKEEAAGKRDPGALLAHDRPPLDDGPVPLDDLVAEAELELLLRRGRPRPVVADPLRARVRRPEGMRPVDGVVGEEGDDGLGIAFEPRAAVRGDPLPCVQRLPLLSS